MGDISEEDFKLAVQLSVDSLPGISHLYPNQLELLKMLVKNQNVFMTSPTNSGKTLPAIILPLVLRKLNHLGNRNLPVNGKVLFLTALNSIQMSMIASTRALNIACESVTSTNVDELVMSNVSILFVGPEVLQKPSVKSALLRERRRFVLKVVDEVHLCKIKTKCG